MNRRNFLHLSASAACGLSLFCRNAFGAAASASPGDPPFKISLAEWSLNKSLRAGKLTNLDFPRVAKRDYGIDCIEFVDQFFADKAKDNGYLSDLKQRAEGEGVTMGLIMIDTTGDLGAADKTARHQNVDKTLAWVDAAKILDCHTVRINARGPQKADELSASMAESCARLADYAAERAINIAIENHGGLSSNANWLVSLVQQVNKPNFGLLPDFGNFDDTANRYDAVEKMMPYAKAVSAKASGFTDGGLVAETDYFRMLRIVRDGGYAGHIGVESGARTADLEGEAIKKTRDLLQRVFAEQARLKPIFNGRNLDGWTKIEGGDWSAQDGVLIGKNGKNWSTSPERAGSWLSTSKQYGDFRLEFQFAINQGGNSGVFFRSSREKNPAFTGFEMQIHDSAGRPPSKGGVGSLYDVVAPTKNVMRPAGQWNFATITARGPKIAVDMNGERILETEQTRSMKGYIGLQIHDDHSEIRFKNIRLEEI